MDTLEQREGTVPLRFWKKILRIGFMDSWLLSKDFACSRSDTKLILFGFEKRFADNRHVIRPILLSTSNRPITGTLLPFEEAPSQGSTRISLSRGVNL